MDKRKIASHILTSQFFEFKLPSTEPYAQIKLIFWLHSLFNLREKLKRKTWRKQKDKQIFGSDQKAEKVMEHEGDGDVSGSWWNWNNPKRSWRKIGGIGY